MLLLVSGSQTLSVSHSDFVSYLVNQNLSVRQSDFSVREGFKIFFLKIMENSIIGGEGSFSISNLFYFFCSKWSKNHFETLKFFLFKIN